jgi:hypothetical protein
MQFKEPSGSPHITHSKRRSQLVRACVCVQIGFISGRSISFTSSPTFPGGFTVPPRQFRIGLVWANITGMYASGTDITAPDTDAMEVVNTVNMALTLLNTPNSAANKLFSPSGTLLRRLGHCCVIEGIIPTRVSASALWVFLCGAFLHHMHLPLCEMLLVIITGRDTMVLLPAHTANDDCGRTPGLTATVLSNMFQFPFPPLLIKPVRHNDTLRRDRYLKPL